MSVDLVGFFDAAVQPSAAVRSEEGLFNVEAAKGKARPQSQGATRGQSSSQVGSEQEVDAGNSLQDEVEIYHHPKVEKDIKGLNPARQARAKTLIAGLAMGVRHSSTHPLHSLKGWESTKIDAGHIIIHQKRDEGLYVGYIGGQHNYDAAARRLASFDLLTHFSSADVQYRVEYPREHPGEGHSVASIGGEDVGRLRWDYNADTPTVIDMSVDPEHRRKGIGTGLFEKAKQNESQLQHSDVLTDDGREFRDSFKEARVDSRNYNEDASTVEERPHRTTDGTEYTMRYAQYDAGEQKPRHQILLHHDGDQVGDMEWYGKTGIIHHVNVDEEHSRKGLATAMWNWGQEMKRPPKHSADRTDNGDAWAKAVGGPRPRKAKYSAMDEIQALAEKAPGWEHEHEWLPHERIFSAGKGGLDPRLFNPKTRIMLPGPEHATLGDLDDYWRPLYGPGWRNWARVYLAGSQASEWWGNNDFDTLIGIDHNKLRETLPEFQGITDVMIDAKLTAGLRDHLNSEEYLAPWDGQIWHRTFFVNPNSWDIRKIKPYAAYDITNRRWAVEPVKAGLDWGPLKLPEALFSEGEALVQQVNAIEKLPEPQRSGRGAALWDYLHNDRRRAFSDEGEGVFDTGNAVWKYLDMHPSAPLTRLLDMKRHVLQQEHAA